MNIQQYLINNANATASRYNRANSLSLITDISLAVKKAKKEIGLLDTTMKQGIEANIPGFDETAKSELVIIRTHALNQVDSEIREAAKAIEAAKNQGVDSDGVVFNMGK